MKRNFASAVCIASLILVIAGCAQSDSPETGCDYFYPDFTTLELNINSRLSEGVYSTEHECIQLIEFSADQVRETGMLKLDPACQISYYGDFEYTTSSTVSNVLSLSIYSECGLAYDSVSGAQFFELDFPRFCGRLWASRF